MISGVAIFWLTEGLRDSTSTKSALENTPNIEQPTQLDRAEPLEPSQTESNLPKSQPNPSQTSKPAPVRNTQIESYPVGPVTSVLSVKGFTFQLLDCEIVTGASAPFTCNFLIKNDQDDRRQLGIYASPSTFWRSRVVDSQGNEILGILATFGEAMDEREAKAYLSSGVPLKASISFGDIPEGKITLIDLGAYLYGGGGGSFNVECNFSES